MQILRSGISPERPEMCMLSGKLALCDLECELGLFNVVAFQQKGQKRIF